MRDIFIRVDEETSRTMPRRESGLLEASKPYVTVFLIIAILLSVWAGFCAG
jgi:hypothetical protein